MSFDPTRVRSFTYDSFAFDHATATLSCRYRLDGWSFVETVRLPGLGAEGAQPPAQYEAVLKASRLVFLLAGVSYYKAAAPPIIEFGEHALTSAEAALLRAFYIEGLGEYAYRNGVDLTDVEFSYTSAQPAPLSLQLDGERPLIPFGGGIDSIVTVELVRPVAPDAALFVVGRDIAAIEAPARVAGLPVVRATRELDPQILRSRELGFRNGHVPITGVLSAIAVLAAVLDRRGAVIMSNEWSASKGNLVVDGREINHQFSKSLRFEQLLRGALADNFVGGPDYFSLLRPLSELRIAQLFSELDQYHPVFRSCNRSFTLDPARRLDRWCGECDKCCFIDLILAAFMTPAALGKVFSGSEPLANPALLAQFMTLIGVSPDVKPFECVGDIGECRAAVIVASRRPDRVNSEMLGRLRGAMGPAVHTRPDDSPARFLSPLGPHFVPERYASFAFVG